MLSSWVDRLLDLGCDVDAAVWRHAHADFMPPYIGVAYGCGAVGDLYGSGCGEGYLHGYGYQLWGGAGFAGNSAGNGGGYGLDMIGLTCVKYERGELLKSSNLG